MSLMQALDTAQSSLGASSTNIAVISKNLQSAGQAGYAERTLSLVTNFGLTTTTVQRMINAAVQQAASDANSASSRSSAIMSGLGGLASAVGDPTSGNTLSDLLTSLSNSLQAYAADPTSASLGAGVAQSAGSIASALNSASGVATSVRNQADAGIAASVSNINQLLAQFANANAAVVSATPNSQAALDAADQRDQILSNLSAEIGVRTQAQPNGGMAIYTDSGITLFEGGRPRSVAFSPSTNLSSGTQGGSVIIDGVDATSPMSPMPLQSGNLAGLVALRDNYGVTMQTQLDAAAGALISSFKETDQTGSGAPDQAGLFTWSGGPAMPTSTAGLAASIKVNANADPAQGGDPTLIRDGGVSNPGNPAYSYNTTGAAGYTDRLTQLENALGQAQTFPAGAQLGTSQSIAAFLAASAAWVGSTTQTQQTVADQNTARLSTANQSLQQDTGVSVDAEMTKMLEVEKSYQASAKIVTTVQNMLDSLFSVIAATTTP